MLELPLPYMHQLLKNDGTIVFDNVLYKVDIGKELSDASGVDAFTSFGFPFQVIRDKSVQDKLNDYLVNNRAVLEDMIEESLAQQVQNNPVTEQRRSNVANYDLFKMFIKDVVPEYKRLCDRAGVRFVVDNPMEFYESLENEAQNQEIDEETSRRRQIAERKRKAQEDCSFEKVKESLLKEMGFSFPDMFNIGGNLYALSQGNKEPINIIINGKTLVISGNASFDIDSLASRFISGIQDNITKYVQRTVGEIEIATDEDDITVKIQGNKFHDHETGIGLKEIPGEGMCAYVDVKPYVLVEKAFNPERYYEFPGVTVFIPVKLRRGKVAEVQYLRNLQPYTHPALPNQDQAKQVLCPDSRDDKYQVFRDLFAEYKDEPDTFIARMLHLGMATLTKNYLVPEKIYNPLDRSFWQSDRWQRSIEQVRAKGLEVTNKYGNRNM